MPVPKSNLKNTTPTPTEEEVDSIVDQVRERLCLKSHAKVSARQRMTPYTTMGATRKRFVLGGPAKCDSPGCLKRESTNGSACSCSVCSKGTTTDQRKSTDFLEQLLAEQRLILEAVRRIHHDDELEVNDSVQNGDSSALTVDSEQQQEEKDEEELWSVMGDDFRIMLDAINLPRLSCSSAADSSEEAKSGETRK